MKPIISLAFVVLMCESLGAQEPAKQEARANQFVPGEVWLDTNGKPIQAHGGGVIVQDKTWSRILVRKMREAPAPFKYGSRYYLITSGCTGWTPNAAGCAVADNILGPWESKGNPCTGPEAELTFRSQSACVLPVPSKPGAFVFMADRWMPRRLSDSRYIWLPLTIGSDGTVTVPWLDQWDLSRFDKH